MYEDKDLGYMKLISEAEAINGGMLPAIIHYVPNTEYDFNHDTHSNIFIIVNNKYTVSLEKNYAEIQISYPMCPSDIKEICANIDLTLLTHQVNTDLINRKVQMFFDGEEDEECDDIDEV